MSQVSLYFSEEDLDIIKCIIQDAEKKTSSEIRVKMINQYDDGIFDPHQQALREFEREGLHNTQDKIGVLLLVVLGERRFTILGDSGIYSKLPQSYWDELANRLSMMFRTGGYTLGVCRIVKSIGDELAKYFPRQVDDINELPDEVILGGQQ